MGIYTVLISGIATVALINLWPEIIVSVFNSDNPRLVAETIRGLKLHLFTMYLDGFIVVITAYFQSLGRYKAATWVTMGNMLVQIPLTLPERLGVTGVWIVLPVSNIFLALLAAVLLRLDLKKRPIEAGSTISQQHQPRHI